MEEDLKPRGSRRYGLNHHLCETNGHVIFLDPTVMEMFHFSNKTHDLNHANFTVFISKVSW
jgi:hypothetical protein